MKNFYLIGACVLAFFVSSCSSPKTLYSWYNYDDASHMYAKKQTEETEQVLLKNFDKILKKQRGLRKVVPPGIYAERGYYFVKNGKIDEGVKMFEMEKKLYPESAVFMDRLIKNLKR